MEAIRERREFDIAVIGGGAAGLMAAVCGAETPGIRVGVFEAKSKPGKRLLATGNGRCNLSNRSAGPAHYHGDTDKIAPLLERYSPETVEGLFRGLGLICREGEEGRLYPYTLQASSVLSALLRRAEDLGAAILCDSPVSAVSGKRGGFSIRSGEREFCAKAVIFATGGLSYPALGGSGSGWEMLRSLGHSIAPAFPSLVQLLAPKRLTAPLKGVRLRGAVSLLLDGAAAASSEGEIQFTEKGVSGICVFELSRAYGEYVRGGGKDAELSCDLAPDFTLRELTSYLRERTASRTLPLEELLDGLTGRQAGKALLRRALPGRSGLCRELGGGEIASVAKAVKDLRFPVTGTAGWEAAQVTAGGVRLREVNLETMESRLCPGLFLTGELLNVDGDCGGYNLHWAWSTGCAAGKSAAADWRKTYGRI